MKRQVYKHKFSAVPFFTRSSWMQMQMIMTKTLLLMSPPAGPCRSRSTGTSSSPAPRPPPSWPASPSAGRTTSESTSRRLSSSGSRQNHSWKKIQDYYIDYPHCRVLLNKKTLISWWLMVDDKKIPESIKDVKWNSDQNL